MGNVIAQCTNKNSTSSDYITAYRVNLAESDFRGNRKIFNYQENGVGTIKIRILGSDGICADKIVVPEFTVPVSSSDYITIDEPWKIMELQVADAVNGVHGSLTSTLQKAKF